jgi:hypothetical protein
MESELGLLVMSVNFYTDEIKETAAGERIQRRYFKKEECGSVVSVRLEDAAALKTYDLRGESICHIYDQRIALAHTSESKQTTIQIEDLESGQTLRKILLARLGHGVLSLLSLTSTKSNRVSPPILLIYSQTHVSYLDFTDYFETWLDNLPSQ